MGIQLLFANNPGVVPFLSPYLTILFSSGPAQEKRILVRCRLDSPGTSKASVFLQVFRQRVLGRVTSVTACSLSLALVWACIIGSLILLSALNTIPITYSLNPCVCRVIGKGHSCGLCPMSCLLLVLLNIAYLFLFVFIVSRSTAALCSNLRGMLLMA